MAEGNGAMGARTRPGRDEVFFYWSDDGDLMALRVRHLKLTFIEQHGEAGAKIANRCTAVAVHPASGARRRSGSYRIAGLIRQKGYTTKRRNWPGVGHRSLAHFMRSLKSTALTTALAVSVLSPWALASSLTVSEERVLTLAATAKRVEQPGWRAQYDAGTGLAVELAKSNRGEAIEVLLRLGDEGLLSWYVQYFKGSLSPEQELLAAAYVRRWPEYPGMIAKLSQAIHQNDSRELFEALRVAYIKARAAAPHSAELYSSEHLLRALLATDLPGIEPQVTELLRVEKEPSYARLMAAFLGGRRYLPAQELMLTELRRTPLSRFNPIENIASSVTSLRTDAALNAVAEKAVDVAQTELDTVDVYVQAPAVPSPGAGRRSATIGTRPADEPPTPRRTPVEARLKLRNDTVKSLLNMVMYGPPDATLDTSLLSGSRLSVFTAHQQKQIALVLEQRAIREAIGHSITTDHLCKGMSFYWGADSYMAFLFIDKGVDVNVQCKDGAWPITLAAWRGGTVLARMLDAGANPNRLDEARDGVSTLDLVVTDPMSLSSATVLLDHGANPNLPNRNGRTPLYKATSAGRLDAVKLLVERGADVNFEMDGGLTPRLVAQDFGHTDVESFLAAHGGRVNAAYVAKRAADRIKMETYLRLYGTGKM